MRYILLSLRLSREGAVAWESVRVRTVLLSHITTSITAGQTSLSLKRLNLSLRPNRLRSRVWVSRGHSTSSSGADWSDGVGSLHTTGTAAVRTTNSTVLRALIERWVAGRGIVYNSGAGVANIGI